MKIRIGTILKAIVGAGLFSIYLLCYKIYYVPNTNATFVKQLESSDKGYQTMIMQQQLWRSLPFIIGFIIFLMFIPEILRGLKFLSERND